MSQDGLNLNPVRNGDAISNTSNQNRGEHTASNVQFVSTARKTLEAPSAVNNHSSPTHIQPPSRNGPSGSHLHHTRNISATISLNGEGRRKYFPKLLQPPKQRHTGTSPSPSINSVVSAAKNVRNQKNGHGKIVSITSDSTTARL